MTPQEGQLPCCHSERGEQYPSLWPRAVISELCPSVKFIAPHSPPRHPLPQGLWVRGTSGYPYGCRTPDFYPSLGSIAPGGRELFCQLKHPPLSALAPTTVFLHTLSPPHTPLGFLGWEQLCEMLCHDQGDCVTSSLALARKKKLKPQVQPPVGHSALPRLEGSHLYIRDCLFPPKEPGSLCS